MLTSLSSPYVGAPIIISSALINISNVNTMCKQMHSIWILWSKHFPAVQYYVSILCGEYVYAIA